MDDDTAVDSLIMSVNKLIDVTKPHCNIPRQRRRHSSTAIPHTLNITKPILYLLI